MSVLAYGRLSKTQLAIGILQFCSTWLLIGYIWSILWGILAMLKKSPELQPLARPGEAQPYNQAMVGGTAPNPWEVPHQGP